MWWGKLFLKWVSIQQKHNREGYKIVITDKFYELSDGKIVLYFGELRHRLIVQEVWNKTIGLYRSQEVIPNARRTKANY